MNEAFELLDPVNAQEFLGQLGAAPRRLGEVLFRNGKVQELKATKPGVAYEATILEEPPRQVTLFYDESEGWMGDCSCGKENGCEHIFAVMRALLVENSAAKVRGLSSGRTQAAEIASVRTQKKDKADEESGGLARRLMSSLNRPLQAEETRFIKRIATVYTRSRQTQHITHWDFNEMGLPIGGYSWNALQIWPEFPKSEYEFWLYVANAAQEHGSSIPEFMQDITDLRGIREKLEQWTRNREIDRWKSILGNIAAGGYSEPLVSGKTDLRLVIDRKEAHLEWLPPGQTAFVRMKHAQVQQLARNENHSGTQFEMEAELLWHFFAQRFHMASVSANMQYDSLGAEDLLRRIVRLPALESRIVDIAGVPLARPDEPLRWQLTPTTDEKGDYLIRLVQPDGSAVTEIIRVLEGPQKLYLTPHAIYKGPPIHSRLLSVTEDNRIPAPALERSSGVEFLNSLAIELPQRIRERVRVSPFQVTVQCRLQPVFPGSNAEDCVITVSAQAPDGHEQRWDGFAWHDTTPEKVKRNHGAGVGSSIVVYDKAPLQEVRSLLEPLGPKPSTYGQWTGVRVTKKFGEIFAAWVRSIPPHIKLELEGELASFANADVAGSLKLDVTEADIDWFDLRVVLDVSDTTLTPAEVKLLLNAKGGYVRLQGKGWRRLQYNINQEEDERLARLGLSTRELSAEPQRLHALQLADEAAKKFLPEAQVEQIQRRAAEIKTRVSPDVPAGVTAQMRPYQLEGFHFLAYLSANHFGGILADDMGLGKTVQTLAWLIWLRAERKGNGAPAANKKQKADDNKLPASLVVCPKSVMDNWQAEAQKFTPELRVKCWSARDLDTLHKGLDEADVHVLNYNQLRSLGESLLPIRWHALILDEGQYIKNPTSQTAQVARALKAEHRLVLSGTPIENRLLDLWSLMAFTMPGVLGSRAQFARLYDTKGDPLARRRLSSRVRPFLLRRTKNQVAKDLPDKIEEDLFCEIEGEQQTLYRAELKRAQQMLLSIKTQKELAQQQFHFLTSLLRLRQICCHPRLINPESTVDGAKAEALLDLLEPLMEEGQKVLVFSQFVELLNLLKPVLKERQWPFFYLAGETENRGELVKDFQAAEGAAVFLISLKAGGFGLNLTAASYVVLFDPWWNPAVETQAIDRTHRIGQTNKVVAYRLLIKNSIEEKIRELQKNKKALAEDVLGEEKFAQSLTIEDLHFLFAD